METVATFERVKSAFDHLVANGEKPSAAKIVALVGGSKSTVLVHLRAIIADVEGVGTIEPGQQLLEYIAGNTTRRLWDEARKLARADFDRRIEALIAAQSDLFADLQEAVAAEEAVTERLKEASDRIDELEAELAHRCGAEEHLARLKELVTKLEGPPDRTPREQLVQLLGDGQSHSKASIYRRMGDLGYEPAAVQKARYHAVSAGEIEQMQPRGTTEVYLRLADKQQSRSPQSEIQEKHR